jgi:hypothetical protein
MDIQSDDDVKDVASEAGKRPDRAIFRAMIRGAASGLLWTAFAAYFSIINITAKAFAFEFVGPLLNAVGYASLGALCGLFAVIGFRLITRRR